ncbi:hypothetical protein HDU77_009022, partial [Chytriomyces hyalinus]
MATPNRASSTLLERIRNDTEHADVELVFEDSVVLTAHANVLASASDYYKEALSAKWTNGRESNTEESLEAVKDETDLELAHISKKRRTSSKPTRAKITLNHPTIDAEIGKIVLDFLYLGDVEIPPLLISSVIAFADEILVASLVQKCVDHIVSENKLSPEHALECYLQFDRVHAIDNSKAYALTKMLENLPLSLESGRELLAQMNERAIETLLLFTPFKPLHRWRILIA